MQLLDIGFLDFRLLDAVDILLVALLLFALYRIVRGSVALNIFIGFLLIYLLWFIVDALQMRVLASILDQFTSVGVIALLIVFQQEIRRFLLMLGKNRMILANSTWWRQILPWNWRNIQGTSLNFNEIAEACRRMSLSKTGGLIVLGRASDLKFWYSTGVKVDAELNARMLESIFFKNSPLHDGAVVLVNDRIKAASCILPVSERTDLPLDYGLRHRSALGITEQTDAFAIIIIEETGRISIASRGEIVSGLSQENLAQTLASEYNERLMEEVEQEEA